MLTSSRGLRGEEATLRSDSKRFLGKAQASGRPTAYPGFGGCLHPHNTVRLYLDRVFCLYQERSDASTKGIPFPCSPAASGRSPRAVLSVELEVSSTLVS